MTTIDVYCEPKNGLPYKETVSKDVYDVIFRLGAEVERPKAFGDGYEKGYEKCMARYMEKRMDSDAYNEGMNDGIEYVIDECARIISEIPNMCGHTCPIDCDQKTAGKCVDAWKTYLKAQMEV